MDEFERLLKAERGAVERFVRFRVSRAADADDVLQEVYLTAYQRFSQLRDKGAFKAWMLSIARNKCNDYFRKSRDEIPLDELAERELADGRHGVRDTVRETLSRLGDSDRQILGLYFWRELPQARIAELLGIPLGTVKSRLHTAKRNFKSIYPHPAGTTKGGCIMKKLPEVMPEYRIEEREQEPFEVKWEELPGWFLVPREGESLTWGMYDAPSGRLSHVYDMRVTGRARVHGVEGVEISVREDEGKEDAIQRVFIAQLTDTHCRYLAAFRNEGGVRSYITFLDSDEFAPNWGFGENNCGSETNLRPKGLIKRKGSTVTCERADYLMDIAGRYTVTIDGKSHDTVCLMDIEANNCGVLTEQFIDKTGRTVLWRRFNRDDWAMDIYGKSWTEQLPTNDTLTVNGITYVHWYDCLV